MKESDLLDSLLREWRDADPPAGLEESVVAAYRAQTRKPRPTPPLWQRFWRMQVNVPVPVLLAALAAIFGWFLWLRPAAPSPSSPGAADAVTRLNASGFQPLPNGDARVIPAMEIQK